MMNLEKITKQIPDYAKDLRLNLESLVTSSSLEQEEIYSIAFAVALITKQKYLIEALAQEITPKNQDAAKTAFAMMSLTNIWYKFSGLHKDRDIKSIPPRLRTGSLTKHGGVSKKLFEFMSLAVSVANACPLCVNAHIHELKELGVSSQNLADIGRITAVVKAVGEVLAVEYLACV